MFLGGSFIDIPTFEELSEKISGLRELEEISLELNDTAARKLLITDGYGMK